MEDIRLYDFEGNLLHIEHDIISSNWTIYYNAIGTWEGHFNIKSSIVHPAMQGKYLVVIQGDKQAVVTGKHAETELVLYGRTPNWLLSKRVMPPFKTSTLSVEKDVESIARYVVSHAFPEMAQGAVKGFAPFRDFWRNTANALSDVVSDCLGSDGGGHKVVFEPKKKTFTFEVLKGAPIHLMISEGNRNAYNTEYTESLLDYYTAGWYERELEDLGQWDPVTNTPELIENLPENFGRFYTASADGARFGLSFKEGDYIVCRSQNGAWEKAKIPEPVWSYFEGENPQTGMYRWEGVLSAATGSEAKSALSRKKWEQDLTCKTKNLTFGSDYQLGDVVRIQKKTGEHQSAFFKRIEGVTIWYEQNNMGQQPLLREV